MKTKKLWGIKYYGGKSKVINELVALIPPKHIRYVEGFGGMMSVLLSKPVSPVEVYNDIDGKLVNFWRVLQDKRLFQQLMWRLYFTPYSAAEFERAKKVYEVETDPVMLAWAFVVKFAMSYNAHGKYFSRVYRPGRNVAQSFFNLVDERLALLRERIRYVVIENMDIYECIDKYDSEETVFFFDPPYPPETLRGQLPYAFVMTTQDHIRFAERLRDIAGSVILTTYPTDYYMRLLDYGFSRIDKNWYVESTVKPQGAKTIRTTTIFVKYSRKTLDMNKNLDIFISDNRSSSSSDGLPYNLV